MKYVRTIRIGSRISRVSPFCFELRTHTRASRIRAHSFFALICWAQQSIYIALGSPININFFSSIEALTQVHFTVTCVSLSISRFTYCVLLIISKQVWAYTPDTSRYARHTPQPTLSTTEDRLRRHRWRSEEGFVRGRGVTFCLPKAKRITCPGFEDNQETIALAANPLHSARSKHIDVRFHFVRELRRAKNRCSVFVLVRETREYFVKALAAHPFKSHRKNLLNLLLQGE